LGWYGLGFDWTKARKGSGGGRAWGVLQKEEVARQGGFLKPIVLEGREGVAGRQGEGGPVVEKGVVSWLVLVGLELQLSLTVKVFLR
jgi:hypothetical protein